MATTRAPRADAIRNRCNILAAARDQITLNGPDVGMDQIAAAAGVAVGTLYRHFPTKTDLVAAVVTGYIEQVAADAESARARVADGARAVDELAGFLERVIEDSAANHAVKAAAQALGAEHDTDCEMRARTALADLIEAAKADGDLTRDLTVEDIYLLVTTAPTDQPRPVRQRWLSLVLSGLTRADLPAVH